MNEQDWENYLTEPPAFDPEFEPVFTPVLEYPPAPKLEPKKKSKQGSITREYLYINKTTRKSTFFVTYDGSDGVKGFWIPNSVIITDTGNEVEFPDWLKIKEIQWGEW
ncbi:MAG: hypothetical protein GOVbin8609_65 [Prokaryotic dsDNA virus sp.]|nr:MAG: hypothetical protein GOVbin8609_65 [Prokaryotic dsDNA virus sp.]|tara:strand:- start:11249 stop:11572 length:324 start_codon:yes stop_codon:yes gene_type:complete